MNKLKRLSALALVLTVLFAAFASFGAQAANGDPPTNLRWEDYTAKWDAPSGSDLWGYQLDLYIDGNYITYYDIGTPYMDFKETMLNCGPGDYSYGVCAVYEESNGYRYGSTTYYSPTFTYSGELEHKHSLSYHSAKSATCTSKGNKAYYSCAGCGEWFWDAAATQVITNHSSVTVAALGHNWGAWKTIKEPTPQSEGEERRVCKRDSSHVESNVLPRLKVQPPTERREPTEPKRTETKAAQTTAAATAASTEASTAVETTTGETVQTTEATTAGGGITISGSVSPLIFVIIGILAFLLLIVIPAAIVIVVILLRRSRR